MFHFQTHEAVPHPGYYVNLCMYLFIVNSLHTKTAFIQLMKNHRKEKLHKGVDTLLNESFD